MGAFTDIQNKPWKYNINFKDVFFLVREELPYTKERKGAIFLLWAPLVVMKQENLICFYGITKTMVLVINKLLARELQSYRIRVNSIAPGVIKTKISEARWKDREQETIKSEGNFMLKIYNSNKNFSQIFYKL